MITRFRKLRWTIALAAILGVGVPGIFYLLSLSWRNPPAAINDTFIYLWPTAVMLMMPDEGQNIYLLAAMSIAANALLYVAVATVIWSVVYGAAHAKMARTSLVGGLIGFIIPISCLAQYRAGHGFGEFVGRAQFYLWPGSILLRATEGREEHVFGYSLVALSVVTNFLLYAMVAALIWKLVRLFAQSNSLGEQEGRYSLR